MIEHTQRKFSLIRRMRSLTCALRGIRMMVRSQHNAWIHAGMTGIVISAGIIAGLTTSGWCWITLAIVSVWTAEAFNTALEFLTDLISPDYHPLAMRVKDISAGAVLITALGACIIGVLVFGPYLADIF